MLVRWQFWVTTIVSLLVALVVAYSTMQVAQNRAAAADLTLRMQTVQKAVQLEPLYREIVKALADLSVRGQDKALSDLLATQGITVNAPAPSAPVADPKKGTKP